MNSNYAVVRSSGNVPSTNNISTTNQSGALTSGQIAQILTNIMQEGGASSINALNLLNLLNENKNTPIEKPLIDSLSQLLNKDGDKNTDIASSLQQLAAKFESQVRPSKQYSDTAQPRTEKNTAATQNSQAFTNKLLGELTKGRTLDKNSLLQLERLLKTPFSDKTSKQLANLLFNQSNLTNSPEKSKINQLTRLFDQIIDKADVSEKQKLQSLRHFLRQAAIEQDELLSDNKKLVESQHNPIKMGERQQSDQNRQSHTAEWDDEDDEVGLGNKKADHINDPILTNTQSTIDTDTSPIKNKQLLDDIKQLSSAKPSDNNISPLKLISPAMIARSTITTEQAERSLQRVTGSSLLSISQVGSIDIAELILKTTNLSLGSFSSTAEMVIKAKKIYTHAQGVLNDKKVEEFKVQLEKQIKADEKAKKLGILGIIFAVIVAIVAVATAVFTGGGSLAILAAVIASAMAILTTTQYILSSKGLLTDKLAKVLGFLSMGLGLGVVVFSVGAIAINAVLKATANVAKLISKNALKSVEKFVDKLKPTTKIKPQEVLSSEKKMGRILAHMTTINQVLDSASTGTLKIQKAQLDKIIGKLANNIQWKENMLQYFNLQQMNANSRLQLLFGNYADSVEVTAQILHERGSLQARIASSLV